jgi:two-component system, OmpR family, copper resistance phosphate regulon response regulator CusR
MRVLLVEDEPSAAKVLAKGLRERGYAVDISADGVDAGYKTSINEYDLVILDVMLPRKSGLQVCNELRATGAAMPILMLTARDAIEDRIVGLDSGADDYLTKPFDYRELLARIHALLRRGPTKHFEDIQIDTLRIHIQARRVARAGVTVQLTAKEYALLEYLARRSGELVTRGEISEHVWDETFDPFSNLIEVYVQRLRRKIDASHPVKLIHTRRGEGYILADRSWEHHD